MQAQAKRVYALTGSFVFLFFFAQASAMSLLSIWLTRTLHLTGVQVGTVFSANFAAAMGSQPIYGYLSDRAGLRKQIPLAIGVLVILAGPFFTLVYGPLLRGHLVIGAIAGGVYLGVTFVAGSYALEAYVNRVGRRYGFEYSRARLWGSLGFALAAVFSGRLYNIDPAFNFYMASVAGLALVPLVLLAPVGPNAEFDPAIPKLRPADSLAVLMMPRFWGFMVLILGVTNLYLVYDQQFPFYFSSLFATPARGAAMFGYLNSVQIFVEAGLMFVAPLLVRRIGAKNGLLLATGIMIARIASSGFAAGPLSISACKMLHSIELPILAVSIFRYIALHFDLRLSATLYMVGVSFGHSLGLAILSPIVGLFYDRIGFASTYLVIAAFASVFWILSWFTLHATPSETERGLGGRSGVKADTLPLAL